MYRQVNKGKKYQNTSFSPENKIVKGGGERCCGGRRGRGGGRAEKQNTKKSRTHTRTEVKGKKKEKKKLKDEREGKERESEEVQSAYRGLRNLISKPRLKN